METLNHKNNNVPLNILIVDDEETILDILSLGLEHRGYNCFTALTAEEGLRIIKMEKIHFSLLDINLPDGNGIDLCNEIKKLSPSTVNVIITGYPGIKSAIAGMKNNAYDYLVKPFHIEQVIAVIEKAKRELILFIDNKYNEEAMRTLKEENEQLKKFINEMMPDETRQRIQSLNKFRNIKAGEQKAAQSYLKHSRKPTLPIKKKG